MESDLGLPFGVPSHVQATHQMPDPPPPPQDPSPPSRARAQGCPSNLQVLFLFWSSAPGTHASAAPFFFFLLRQATFWRLGFAFEQMAKCRAEGHLEPKVSQPDVLLLGPPRGVVRLFSSFCWEGFPLHLTNQQRRMPFFPVATGHLNSREATAGRGMQDLWAKSRTTSNGLPPGFGCFSKKRNTAFSGRQAFAWKTFLGLQASDSLTQLPSGALLSPLFWGRVPMEIGSTGHPELSAASEGSPRLASAQVAELQAMDQGLAGALDSAWLCLCGALAPRSFRFSDWAGIGWELGGLGGSDWGLASRSFGFGRIGLVGRAGRVGWMFLQIGWGGVVGLGCSGSLGRMGGVVFPLTAKHWGSNLRYREWESVMPVPVLFSACLPVSQSLRSDATSVSQSLRSDARCCDAGSRVSRLSPCISSLRGWLRGCVFRRSDARCCDAGSRVVSPLVSLCLPVSAVRCQML